MGKIYRTDYKIPFYETDKKGNAKLPHLLSHCLQISGFQSAELGVSDENIFDRYGLVWVITDYEITIDRLPKYAEEIIIETEAISYNKLFCYREFRLFDQTGQKLMTLFCSFVLLDFNSRKVTPVPEDVVAVYGAEKIKKMLRGPKYPTLDHPVEKPYHVRYLDLDMNGHVNNAKYLEWMYDVLPVDFLEGHVPETIHLKYAKEVHYGRDIQSQLVLEDLVSYHDIISEVGNHAQAIITWRPLD